MFVISTAEDRRRLTEEDVLVVRSQLSVISYQFIWFISSIWFLHYSAYQPSLLTAYCLLYFLSLSLYLLILPPSHAFGDILPP